MWRVPNWYIAILVLAVFGAAVADAGTIVRGPKASGGTAFVDGYLATASEVNTDFDRLYNLVNGNIDTNNINSAAGILSGQIANDTLLNVDVNTVAAIAVSKLAQTAGLLDTDIVSDYSNDAAEQATESSPGTSDTPTLALHLETELEQLRYKIHELTVGSSASAVAASGATAALTSWIDGPHRPRNLLYNGGFNIWNSAANAAGDGWTLVLTPDTASTGLTEADGYGDGNGILLTGNGAALEGISQTLDGIKAGAKYLAIAAVKETAGDTCRLFVEDADTNDLTVTSDAVGDWEVLSGTFQADATPTDVIFQLLSVADGDICLWAFAGVYEINTDPVPPMAPLIAFDSSDTDDNVSTVFEDVDGITALQVTPPTSGWNIDVMGVISAERDAGNTHHGFTGRVQENCGGAGAATVALTTNDNVNTQGDYGNTSVVLNYVNTSPAAGVTCVYTLEMLATGDGANLQIANGEGTMSSFRVMAIPPM